jgi:hypothetical protein
MEQARRYVVLDEAGEVVNVAMWDGVSAWHPGDGLRAVLEVEYLAAQAAAQDDG